MRTSTSIDVAGLNISVTLSKTNPLYFILRIINTIKTIWISLLVILSVLVAVNIALVYALLAR